MSPDAAPSSVWPVLHYDDTRAALRFLVDVLGFERAVIAADEHGEIGHAELRWPGGGALVFGSTRHTDSVHGRMRAGSSAVYVVSDDVDAVHQRVVDAGGEVLETPHETRFGSGAAAYVCTVQDPEGNLWTFGTYRGPSPEECGEGKA
ncbi:VOC family protein [Streptomyces sp. STCH 565 A]|uniref:VOC family protein n=1 Tax=Streptomyces sp. STCH 565 A TaxID=2950532 RepID=UPI00207591DC|nr:VOC family protein [Streptomyces sp. STCH 565 A]MCM8555512.1 VOC family protein [Streptomyces sp. STCH 565 A]